MRSGKLNRPGMLHSVTQGVNDAGHAAEAEAAVCKVWLMFVSGTGREFSEALQQNADVTHVIRMRFLPKVRVYPSRHRIKYDDRTFEIVSAVDEREAHETLVLSCIETVAEDDE